jgi:MFS family permease
MSTGSARPSPELLHRPLLLWSLPFSFLYFGLPVISKEFGASAAQIGGLFSVFTGTTLVLRPIAGWLLDRRSAKWFLVVALCFYGAAMAVFAYADSLNWLYAARILQAIGSSILWTSTYTLVAAWTTRENRGQAMGRLTEITTRGGLIGIFAAFFLMSALPDGTAWMIVFSAFAILTLVGALLASRTVPGVAPARLPGEPSSVIAPALIRLLGFVLLLGIPEAMLSPLYLTYLQDRFTVEMETLAWAFFPAALVTAMFSARLGALSDRFGRIPMMALGLAGAGITTLLLPHLPTLFLLAAVYTITTVMWAVLEPAEAALVADLTGQSRRGLAYGLYDFVENLGFTIGPLLGGIVYDTVGRGVPFYISGGVLLLGAALVWLLPGRAAPPLAVSQQP